MKVLNIIGSELQPCCFEPMTGYFRDGYCKTMAGDTGTHVVCAMMTEEFLTFTRRRGNDLTTPIPQWQFPGLKVGDKWCLCVSRWLEAEENGVAPPILLESTHCKALDYAPLSVYKRYATTLNH